MNYNFSFSNRLFSSPLMIAILLSQLTTACSYVPIAPEGSQDKQKKAAAVVDEKVQSQNLGLPPSGAAAPDPLVNQKIGVSVVRSNCQKVQSTVEGKSENSENCDTEVFIRLRFICLGADRKPAPQIMIESEATKYAVRLGMSAAGKGESFKMTGFKEIKNSILEISIPNPNHPKLQLQELTISVGNKRRTLNPVEMGSVVYLEPEECKNFLPESPPADTGDSK